MVCCFGQMEFSPSFFLINLVRVSGRRTSLGSVWIRPRVRPEEIGLVQLGTSRRNGLRRETFPGLPRPQKFSHPSLPSWPHSLVFPYTMSLLITFNCRRFVWHRDRCGQLTRRHHPSHSTSFCRQMYGCRRPTTRPEHETVVFSSVWATGSKFTDPQVTQTVTYSGPLCKRNCGESVEGKRTEGREGAAYVVARRRVLQ